MPAPRGNEYYKYVVNPGRDRIFATPTDLWNAVVEYFNWARKNPHYKIEQLKKPIITKTPKGRTKVQYLVQVPHERAFTYASLTSYLSVSRRFFNWFKSDMEEKKQNGTDPHAEGFLEVLARIDDIMYAQKHEGGLAGIFHPGLVASELKMAKYEEVTEKVIVVKGED